MFHVGRCGSTVVAEMLDRHAEVTWDGEVFEPKVRARIGLEHLAPEAFLRERVAASAPVYGFEVKYLPSHHQRILGLDLDDLLELTDRVGVSHYITLHRHNFLRRVVSGAVGRERKRWHRASGEHVPETLVRIDPRSVPFGPRQPLLDVFEEMKAGEAELKTALADRSALHLTYEEDISVDPAKAYVAVCEFIGIGPEDVRPRLDRTGSESLQSMISNYEEISDLLSGTEYAWMLE